MKEPSPYKESLDEEPVVALDKELASGTIFGHFMPSIGDIRCIFRVFCKFTAPKKNCKFSAWCKFYVVRCVIILVTLTKFGNFIHSIG